jgi:hypothetical protein
MNLKKQFSVIIMVTGLLVTGIVYGDDPVKGANTNSSSGSGSGLGWVEKAMRWPTFISDGIRVSIGPSVGTSGLGFSLSFSSNFNWVDCCKISTNIASWCNFNADDARCPD